MSHRKHYFKLPDVDNLPRQIHESCETYDHFKISDHLLGEGSYGKVHIACEGDMCGYVAKTIQFDFSRYEPKYVYNMFWAECLMTQFAGQKGFGIPVKTFYLCDEGKKGVIIMEKFTDDLESIQKQLTWTDMKQLFDKVSTMHHYGILHRDLFLKNVMYREVNGGRDIRMIDFGLAVAFEKSIPKPHLAVDFLNLISDITNDTLKKECYEDIVKRLKRPNVELGNLWLKTHYETCDSEYSLLKFLPVKWIRMAGPATVDTLVWSVRCNPNLDKDIIEKTQQKILRAKNSAPRRSSRKKSTQGRSRKKINKKTNKK